MHSISNGVRHAMSPKMVLQDAESSLNEVLSLVDRQRETIATPTLQKYLATYNRYLRICVSAVAIVAKPFLDWTSRRRISPSTIRWMKRRLCERKQNNSKMKCDNSAIVSDLYVVTNYYLDTVIHSLVHLKEALNQWSYNSVTITRLYCYQSCL